MRPRFLDAPAYWTRAARTMTTPAESAYAVHRVTRGPSAERIAGVILASAIGAVLAVALVHWWSAA